jgi:hypothetical protein
MTKKRVLTESGEDIRERRKSAGLSVERALYCRDVGSTSVRSAWSARFRDCPKPCRSRPLDGADLQVVSANSQPLRSPRLRSTIKLPITKLAHRY